MSRRVHNPEGLTPHQIGEADGWRCLYENEPVPADAEWFDQMEWKPVRGCGAPLGPRDHLTYRTKRSKPAELEEEEKPIVSVMDQEAERLARKIFDKYRAQTLGLLAFDDLIPDHQRGWIAAAKLFLEEQDVAKDLLVQAVAGESNHRQQWQQRAEKAEAELQEAAGLSHTYRNRAEKAEADLKWWQTTASNHLDGIDGILCEAGTLDWKTDFHGLLIRVPTDVLRDAKRLPLYRKVRVLEVGS